MSAVQTGSSLVAREAISPAALAPTALPAIARLLATIVPESRAPEGEPALELASSNAQPPRLISATIIEGHELRARRVFDPPEVGFAAFLDGTQESRVALYLPSGAPIVSATIRPWLGATMRSWSPCSTITGRRIVR